MRSNRVAYRLWLALRTGLGRRIGVAMAAAVIVGASLLSAGPSFAQKTLSDQELQQLCDSVASKNIPSSQLEGMAGTLGLSSDQLLQLKSCIASKAASGSNTSTNGNNESASNTENQTPQRQLETSSTETRYHELATPYKMYAAPSPKSLQQFGYDLFATKVTTFAQTTNVPVSNDYVLGPGDQLNVLMWGRVNQTLKLEIERDGSLLIPEIGPIEIAGLTFAQAKKLIEGRMGQITGVEVDVTMGQVRTIQVFVIGKVDQPGLYTVSALAHVSNALSAAGGISKTGSLRKIQVRRDNSLVATMDLYDMLLRGDTAGDVQLQPRDVIFVPVIGPVVGITGDVKSPAIYELRGNESLGNVIRMAGGVNAFGYAERIQVERVQNHERRIALDVNLNVHSAGQFPMDDGDLVKVFSVLPIQRNVVEVRGNVNQPGTYEWHPGMRVADLIRESQGPGDHTFFDYAVIQRREGLARKTNMVPLNLGDALANELGPDDVMLRPEDTLVVYSQNELAQVPTVSIRGDVRKPGKYPLTPGMTVRELVYGAGGLMENASLDRAELTRTDIADGSVTKFAHIDIDLRRALDLNQAASMPLHTGDELLVQTASNWHTPWHVILSGEVMRPGPYSIHEGERLSSVLEQSGGFRSDASLRGAVFIRKSVQELQQRELDMARTRLQTEVVRVALLPHQTGAGDNSMETLTAMKSLLAQAEGQQAVGRVVIHLRPLGSFARSSDDVVLENQDKLIVPVQPASVQVLGEVYNPNAIVYDPALRVRDYLQKAGGPTQGADAEHTYVIKVDGSVLTEAGVRDSGRNRLFPLLPSISGGLMDARLEPGDTVYVPDQLVFVDKEVYYRDVTQIVANTAMSLAVLGVLATSL